MKRDILVMSSATLAAALIAWAFWGNPPMSAEPRFPLAQSLDQDPAVKLVTERSPYMRSER
jgi:hypothetical protein